MSFFITCSPDRSQPSWQKSRRRRLNERVQSEVVHPQNGEAKLNEAQGDTVNRNAMGWSASSNPTERTLRNANKHKPKNFGRSGDDELAVHIELRH